MRVPLFNLTISPEDKRAVARTLDSGWLTTGPQCHKLERALAQRCGARHAVALSSATAGLELALRTLDIGPGAEVIVPSFTFSATAAAALYLGATPVFADIDSLTLNLDHASVRARITRRTKALIAVDIAGAPCDYRALRQICREHKLFLICDAAHSLGAGYRNKPVGSLGDITIFSFYSTKNITAGEGGAALTNNKRLAERLRRLSLHGLTSSTAERNRGGKWRYDVTELGRKANLSDINAALALSQLTQLNKKLAARSRRAERYHTALAPYRDYLNTPPSQPHAEQAWHLYIIKLNPAAWKIGRDRFIDELSRLGVGAGVHYIPVHRLSAFRTYARRPATTLPATESVWQNVVTLPLYPELTARDQKFVTDSIAKLIRRYGR
ncbi:MAG TPA: DegT/DnrJ/EryC1/StrS family aminotransferase [candidate division Zixibacteria bacterium]|nr:DegT/DnrJ/EryC1/StrS family aminotransferase [candidate division Zixibacteria bacterium]